MIQTPNFGTTSGSNILNSGVLKQHLKFSGIQYHLYHKQGNASAGNDVMLKDTIDNNSTWCENGIDRYF